MSLGSLDPPVRHDIYVVCYRCGRDERKANAVEVCDHDGTHAVTEYLCRRCDCA